ncbi:MAG TPA: S41 family peptidase [Candidatus Polarisedimenticolia bacterium]|nr:S41 family peptidase [Candidatus Polarisedimenticolia bacterium]
MARNDRFVRARPASGCAVLFILATLGSAAPAAALEECRLLRQPDISRERIVFVYAGDLWTVPRAGGVASRLTTHEGLERFPKFSPDGRTIAMTAEYDGNVDAYTIPVEGGEPTRLTWHPDPDQVAEWYPDGQSILLRSSRASAPRRFDRFFKVAAAGGFEEPLALPTGGYASFSADGRQIAFVSPSYDRRTWKRYKGGNAPDIWIYDFARNTAEKITDWPGADEWPMWHGRTIYYASDRGGRTANLWAYDLETRSHRQVTHFTEFDVKWPSLGDDAIVFENGGDLYVMDLPAEKPQKVSVLVPDDKPGARPEYRNVARWIGAWDLSPSGKRAVIEARGDLFSVPAEKGDVRNLTATPGWRERDPAWSPDGKWIAYLSDQSGEYEIHVVGSDGRTADRQVTHSAPAAATFRFAPRWSPDSKKIAFSDKTLTLYWCDVASGRITRIDRSNDAQIHEYVWSGDSRFIAYALTGPNNLQGIRIYALDTGKVTQVSSGLYEDFSPAFDAEGNALYFISRRALNPQFGSFEFDFQFPRTDKIYAATLRAGAASPVAPQSDEETGEAAGKEGAAKDGGAKEGKPEESKGSAKGGEAATAKAAPPTKPWVIDLDGLGDRVSEVPIRAGRYINLAVFKGKILYQEVDQPEGEPDESDEMTGSIHLFDLDKREDKVVIAGVGLGYAASKDGGKLLYKAKETLGIIDAAEGKKVGDGKMEGAAELHATVAPRQEWLQMFNEAWRLERDFYYDPNMGGIDWKGIGERYRRLVPYVAHRSDLNYILGEMIGELSTSHTYVGGGDLPEPPKVDVGLLGADYDLDPRSGLYRFRTIYRERDWNAPTGAPLAEPGVAVHEGDYLLQVNGRPLRSPQNLYAAFVGTAGKETMITVGSTPGDPKPRTFSVKPIDSETALRYRAWVAANRDKVARATGGRIAYIHIPDTAIPGIQEFARQFYPQIDKDGLIVDERFNGGGFVPDFFINRLRHTTWSYWANREEADERTPADAIDGPKCILINEYAGSGGDAFPYYFRQQGLGPVIGKRTWGGLVGISENLPLVDGGRVTMPDWGIWDAKLGWVVENHGVDPDIEVENAPDLLVAGRDPQLERAIQYTLDQLKKSPPQKPARPSYKVQQ